MVITEILEKNARLYGSEVALVELNPSEERDNAVTWRDFSLIENARPDAPYRREMTWREFDRRANRFANLLLSRGLKRGAKVGILMMNCLEWLPIYFGALKAGCIAVPMNYRYSSDEIQYCLDLADVEALVFGPEFITRMDPISNSIPKVRYMFFVGPNGPDYTEDCWKLMGYCSTEAPPVELNEEDYAAIYFSSGTTGRPGTMSSSASRPSIIRARRCTGSAASWPAARPSSCGASSRNGSSGRSPRRSAPSSGCRCPGRRTSWTPSTGATSNWRTTTCPPGG